MKQIGVLVVEDHAIVRQGLRLILEQEPDITVVGEAESGEEAYTIANEVRPDVIIMDIALPGANGIKTTEKIKQDQPDVHVIALTMHLEDEYVMAMLRAGAEGYLAKDSIASELVQAVRTVNKGQSIVCPAAVKKLIAEVTGRYSPGPHAENILSDREREVLRLIATGATSKEIGRALNLSSKTVDNYRCTIIEKLHVRNKLEAVMYAMKAGLVSI